ncbi:MAG: 2OG-Fe(II) oxygenase family protein [Verrucomicrobiae bacterium]|nr:2OG-Fe(II) oxygenase family protein [Verrucomicrobiae bacterium]
MNRIDAFATPIWLEDLTELEPIRGALVEAVRDLRRSGGEAAERKSNRNGWRSASNLFDLPAFAPLRDRLVPSIRAVLDDYGVRRGSLTFTVPAWANVHDRGGYNVVHVHPGCWLSGTVYLETPPGAGRLFFNDPRPAAVMECLPLRPDRPMTPARAREKFVAQPRNLLLVLFPSWLPHGVEAGDCEERISIAFNVQPALARPDALTPPPGES